jgi:ribosome-binding ATPase YchF (GTP1/OBG family)
MSVRHQKRIYIEELFSNLKQNAGEFRIYNLYVPEDGDIEDLEIIDLEVDFSDPESIKKYLDRTTRETLEGEVKGLKLLAMVLEKEGSYIFSSKEGLSEDFKKQVLEKIEQIKEE